MFYVDHVEQRSHFRIRVGEHTIGHIEKRLNKFAFAIVDCVLSRTIKPRKRKMNAHLGGFTVECLGKVGETI